jgi:hypothetical protein
MLILNTRLATSLKKTDNFPDSISEHLTFCFQNIHFHRNDNSKRTLSQILIYYSSGKYLFLVCQISEMQSGLVPLINFDRIPQFLIYY